MSEVRNDVKRKPVETRTGMRVWGYKTKRELAGEIVVDGLTGLLNRKGWDQRISSYLKHAERSGENFSYVVIDLDNFKRMNDEGGHEAGDRELRKFADILRQVTRSTDIVARYGGDEFAICLTATPQERAEKLGHRLEEISGDIKISAGIGETFAEADREMYKIKEAKNNV